MHCISFSVEEPETAMMYFKQIIFSRYPEDISSFEEETAPKLICHQLLGTYYSFQHLICLKKWNKYLPRRFCADLY